ncbi:hypothetical protein BDZ90DRAFT_230452 [Jaminaea rosea]|uniref:RRM domain-containing protein n=1 Tax=Jaminaea rosea TaxID=1569628 RepID=A0A316UWC7_9BASI|nr:hypothetical protein BDZ90DRAFT_230452 [Jaminaea rosea]PWN29589.1 hypothetical protein BDZ90DRAFT_230452 [Jaminaea rosea]
MSTTVTVTNISANTAKKSIEDFFSFCGSVNSIDVSPDGDKQKATITFAKESAASTAAMLHGGSLDGSPLTVHAPGAASATAPSATAAGTAAPGSTTPTNSMGQEDKPRTAIVAEILAHGYHVSDEVTSRAIALDNQHGLSERFKSYLSTLDRQLGERVVKGSSKEPTTTKTEGTPSGPAAASSAAEKDATATPLPGTTAGQEDKFTTTVPAPDSAGEAAATAGTAQQPSLIRHVQAQVQSQLDRPEVKSRTDFVWAKMTDYYNSLMNQPRIHDLYTKTTKSVSDVHEEAKRIADERKRGGASGAAGTNAPVTTAAK